MKSTAHLEAQFASDPTDFFRGQLEILNNAVVDNCIILGDFNLDAGMEERQDYGYKYPLELLSNFVFENNLLQVVNFNTWSRVIYGIKKESCLDHIYVNCNEIIESLNHFTPTFGDHLLEG